MAGNSGEPGRTVTSKLAAILIASPNGRDYTLSELAMQTNLAISTVHRLLNDLVAASLLERLDGATYRPGPTAPPPAGRREAADAARAGPVRRRGPRLRRCTRPPAWRRRRSRGRLRREEGRSRNPARCSPTRPGCPCTPRPWGRCCSPSGRGPWSGSSAAAPSALHAEDPRPPVRSGPRPPEDPRPRLRRRRRRAPPRGPVPSPCPCSTPTAGDRRDRGGRDRPEPRSGRAHGPRAADGRAVPAPGGSHRRCPGPRGRIGARPGGARRHAMRRQAWAPGLARRPARASAPGDVHGRRPRLRARRRAEPAGSRRSPRR